MIAAYHKMAIPLILLSGLLSVNFCSGQGSLNDSTSNPSDTSFAVNQYYSSIGENAHLYNGPEYLTYDKRIAGNPFFKTDSLTSGDIAYDGSHYFNIPMLYDIIYDEVVINRYQQNFRISLLREKMKGFTFLNHTFYRMEKDSLHGVLLSPGFYDQLYQGKITVLAKRKKKILEKIEYTMNTISYLADDHFYINRNNTYFEVTNKASLLKVFSNKKKEIRKFLRKHKLKFKTDQEKAILQSAAYYDQLSS